MPPIAKLTMNYFRPFSFSGTPPKSYGLMVVMRGAWLWLRNRFQAQSDIVMNLKAKGFQVLPKRWIVERTFAWLGWCRGLSLDYQRKSQHSENMIYIDMIRLMLKRIK